MASGIVPEFECAVCLQPCMYPVKVPCGHIFCFLCIKGAAFQSGKCPMCRALIPPQYFVRPKLVTLQDDSATPSSSSAQSAASPTDTCEHGRDTASTDNCTSSQAEQSTQSFKGSFWYYQGRQGWWQYDERTAADIERSHSNSEQTVELMIAGNLYVIDFGQMIQFRKNEPGKKRRIKRDAETAAKKGVAGLKLPQPRPKKRTAEKNDEKANATDSNEGDEKAIAKKPVNATDEDTEVIDVVSSDEE